MSLIRRKPDGEPWETVVDEGGSGLPESWEVGENGDVIARAAATDETPLKVEAIEGQTQDTFQVNGTAASWQFENDGCVTGTALAGIETTMFSIQFAAAVSHNLFQIVQGFNPFASVLRINKDGYLVIGINAAPADGDLAANECAVWFDSANGAAKIMFKGKTADGTVVDGELALS